LQDADAGDAAGDAAGDPGARKIAIDVERTEVVPAAT